MMEQAEIGCKVSVDGWQARDAESFWEGMFGIMGTDVVQNHVPLLIAVDLRRRRLLASVCLSGGIQRSMGAVR